MKNYTKEIAELKELISEVTTKSFNLNKATNLKVQEVFNDYFNPFREFEIQVSGESAYFKSVDDSDGKLKDLFSVYFYERYKQDTILELSYYTTNTQSEFELDRIIHLGRVAKIIKDCSERILDKITKIKKEVEEESNQLYSIIVKYSKQISQYENAERENKKVELELLLRSEEGVTFSKELYLEVKRNFTPRIKSVKIVEVSKSRKTCTISFKYAYGDHTGVEERCNFDSIISQIMYRSKDIAQLEIAE